MHPGTAGEGAGGGAAEPCAEELGSSSGKAELGRCSPHGSSPGVADVMQKESEFI